MSNTRKAVGARAVLIGLAAGVWFCGFGAAVAHTGSVAPTAAAQDGPTARRTIQGKVHDKNDAALKGAIVYLKDSRTLAVKSFLSDDEGTFHFGQLSSNADYELYAEFGGKRSKSKVISSFDSKQDFNFTLKIDTGV